MNYLSQRKGFLGYDANQKIDNKVIVVPFGLEKTVSYGSGTKNGPKEIIKASHQVELFDEELNKEPYKEIGIKTLKPFLIKKEIIPKLCSKKSDTALPYIPSKLLIFLSNSPYTNDGSEGEYVANDTIRAEHDKIKLNQFIFKFRFLKNFFNILLSNERK